MTNVVTCVGYKVFYSYFVRGKEHDVWGEKPSDECPEMTNRQFAAKQAEEAVRKGLEHAKKYHVERKFKEWLDADKAYFEHCLKASAIDEEGERLQSDRLWKCHELELELLLAGGIEWDEDW